MKKICMAIVMLLAAAATSGVSVSSAEFRMPQQEQGGGQEGEGKVKEKSDSTIHGALGTITNPVRCQAPRGERMYLNRLRCPDGNAPEYHRVGSFGGEAYGNIIDGYRVACGADTVMIYMDMYHVGYIENEAVPGFTIVE